MRFIKHALAVLSLSLMAAGASAGPGNPQNGVDFKTLAKAQPTESGKKVEVIEFFGYFCPHCNALDPALGEWVKKQGDKIVLKRVHVVFADTMVPTQQMYVTLDLMGKTEAVHSKLFDAFHRQRTLQHNATEEQLTAFLGKNGIDTPKYKDMYASFSVQTMMRKANKLIADYGIDNVPQIIVDGKYQTSPDLMRASLGNRASEGDLAKANMQVLDYLVERAAKEKK